MPDCKPLWDTMQWEMRAGPAHRGMSPGCSCCAGIKYTVANLEPAHGTAPTVSRFIHRTSRLLGTPIDRLEPPTVGAHAASPAGSE